MVHNRSRKAQGPTFGFRIRPCEDPGENRTGRTVVCSILPDPDWFQLEAVELQYFTPLHICLLLMAAAASHFTKKESFFVADQVPRRIFS